MGKDDRSKDRKQHLLPFLKQTRSKKSLNITQVRLLQVSLSLRLNRQLVRPKLKHFLQRSGRPGSSNAAADRFAVIPDYWLFPFVARSKFHGDNCTNIPQTLKLNSLIRRIKPFKKKIETGTARDSDRARETPTARVQRLLLLRKNTALKRNDYAIFKSNWIRNWIIRLVNIEKFPPFFLQFTVFFYSQDLRNLSKKFFQTVD